MHQKERPRPATNTSFFCFFDRRTRRKCWAGPSHCFNGKGLRKHANRRGCRTRGKYTRGANLALSEQRGYVLGVLRKRIDRPLAQLRGSGERAAHRKRLERFRGWLTHQIVIPSGRLSRRIPIYRERVPGPGQNYKACTSLLCQSNDQELPSVVPREIYPSRTLNARRRGSPLVGALLVSAAVVATKVHPNAAAYKPHKASAERAMEVAANLIRRRQTAAG